MSTKLDRLLDHLETFLPKPLTEQEWKSSTAFRWRRRDSIFGSIGFLQPVKHVSDITFEDLKNIDRQRDAIRENTKNFIDKKPANNILLTGARGTGKSSLIKASLHEFANQGLRLVEVEKDHLADLADITDLLADRPERFIVFCDDLSFDAGDTSYKSLKAVLEGGIEGRPDNVIFYATSNRLHLMPRDMIENERSTAINPSEAVEEKVSLSDRFGLWLGFHNADQDTFFAMIEGYAEYYKLGVPAETLRKQAVEWSVTRGSRSGRVAWQFVQEVAGQLGKKLG